MPRSRNTYHMCAAPCDNKGADACNYHEFFAPCDNLVASYDNTGADIDVLNSGSSLIYSRRVETSTDGSRNTINHMFVVDNKGI